MRAQNTLDSILNPMDKEAPVLDQRLEPSESAKDFIRIRIPIAYQIPGR